MLAKSYDKELEDSFYDFIKENYDAIPDELSLKEGEAAVLIYGKLYGPVIKEELADVIAGAFTQDESVEVIQSINLIEK